MTVAPVPARTPADASVLVLACGALARELIDVIELNDLDHVAVECLPANLHNHPDRIPEAVRARLDRAVGQFDTVFVGYADCGTAGRLDSVLADFPGVARLPGAHCYEFFLGSDRFADLHDAEPGTFYLTDYLVKHFDRIVIEGLRLDTHPELLDAYFGNYTRLLLLSQVDDPDLVLAGRRAAERLGLRFEHIAAGYGDLETGVVAVSLGSAPVPRADPARAVEAADHGQPCSEHEER